MHYHDILLITVAFLAEVLGTLSGFGSSTFFLPLATRFESFRLVMVLTAILHCFGNTSRVILFWESRDWSNFLKLMPAFVVMTVIGAWYSALIDRFLFEKILGAILILMSFVLLIRISVIAKFGSPFAILLTSLSGLFTGLIGTGGALRGVALSILNLQPNTFVFLSASIDFGGDLLRTIIYLKNNYMEWNQWFYIPLLGVSSYFGSLTGKRLLSQVNARIFKIIIAAIVFASGVLLLIDL